LVVVQVSAGGQVSLANAGAGSIDVVADVVGYYSTSAGGGGYSPLVPSRVLDTRNGNGAPMAPLGGGSSLNLQVAGRGGVPPTGATAVVLNVTVTNTTTQGFMTVWPTGAMEPNASNLNWVAGQTVPNLVVVQVSAGGQVSLANAGAGSIDVVADVVGYYS
jgi:hypothetical protein